LWPITVTEMGKLDLKNKSTKTKKTITLEMKCEILRNFESGMKLNEIASKIILSY